MGSKITTVAKSADHIRSDALESYRAKRNFKVTNEPSGTADSQHAPEGDGEAGWLRYVVQKHWASQLHYDFRLEWQGTLKSWAVPKGPSLDPGEKRMAIQVEDHPLAYAQFEGVIPPAQYGAGRVIVWDEGWWRPVVDADRGLRDGHLKFELKASKLSGSWALVRIKGSSEKQPPWLLIKEKDQFARPASAFSVVDEQPDSVTAPASPLPATLAPQLAMLCETPPADAARWQYELKFDGYRLLARIEHGAVRLFTRNAVDWTHKLTPLRRSLTALNLPPGWYDGEIVMPDAKGHPDFAALQQAFDQGTTDDIVYYLFDLPFGEGQDLRALPLDARRARLQAILLARPSDQVRFSETFAATADSIKASACQLGLEGVIGKRRDAPYRSGRSADWIKLKCTQRQAFVIGGYTEPTGARKGLGALLLGQFATDGALHYVGNVGSGFTDKTLRDLQVRLQALAAPTRTFAATPIAGRPHWVEPRLVAEISFAGWTAAGRLRHAVFHGLRSDKPPTSVQRERSLATASTRHASLRVTHGDRVIDASTGLSKADLVRHYEQVGALMMAHLKGRPLSWLRAPAGLGGEMFFQKHADLDQMAGVRESGLPSAMLEVEDPAGLLSAAQWNVIEFHTSNVSGLKRQLADRMVFDLDPGEGVAWSRVQEAAELMHNFLAELGLPAFLKTSGGKGLHVVVPLRRTASPEAVKAFSHCIVDHLHRTLPQRFVARSGPKNRVGKIFIDYLRNGPGATTVAAWSARARPGMGVSVPVAWDELARLQGGDHWTLRTTPSRLAIGNTPWAAYAKSATGLSRAMKAMAFTPPPPSSPPPPPPPPPQP